MKNIRTALLCLTSAFLLNEKSFAQEMADVVYLKDGSRIVGTIIELLPNQTLTIQTPEGTRYVLSWERIDKVVKEEAAGSFGRRKGMESWYMYWGLGYASSRYPEWLQSTLDLLKQRPQASHTPLALDFFGFYWPLGNQQTVLGFIINGVGDRYSHEGGALQVNLYLYGASAMHFFGEVPGDGIFVRADLGFAAMVISELGGKTRSGMGFLIGGGYGIPLSDEIRLLLQTNYSYRGLGPSESYRSLGVSVGALF